jgi:hypothetical protein
MHCGRADRDLRGDCVRPANGYCGVGNIWILWCGQYLDIVVWAIVCLIIYGYCGVGNSLSHTPRWYRNQWHRVRYRVLLAHGCCMFMLSIMYAKSVPTNRPSLGRLGLIVIDATHVL